MEDLNELFSFITQFTSVAFQLCSAVLSYSKFVDPNFNKVINKEKMLSTNCVINARNKNVSNKGNDLWKNYSELHSKIS